MKNNTTNTAAVAENTNASVVTFNEGAVEVKKNIFTKMGEKKAAWEEKHPNLTKAGKVAGKAASLVVAFGAGAYAGNAYANKKKAAATSETSDETTDDVIDAFTEAAEEEGAEVTEF